MNKEKWPLWYSTYRFTRAPFRWIKGQWNNLCCFFHRGRYGWAWSDVWDIDMYLGKIIPDMLEYLAKNGCSCPMEVYETNGHNDELAHKSWTDELIKNAAKFRYAAADRDNYNPYAEEFRDILRKTGINKDWPADKKELKEKYYNEDSRIYQEQVKQRTEALEWIAKHYDDLWD